MGRVTQTWRKVAHVWRKGWRENGTSELQLWRNSGTKVARRAAQRIREGWPKVGENVLQGVAQRRRKGGAKAGATGGVKNGATECGARVAQIVAQRRRKSGASVAQGWRRSGATQGWRKVSAKVFAWGGRKDGARVVPNVAPMVAEA